MSSFLRLTRNRKESRRNLWFERGMALLALTNLALVLFDSSYISLRNFYLREFPQLTVLYDPIKAIEPHRDTQRYLKTAEKLKSEVAENGLRSPQVEQTLQQLRSLSIEMVETNPFAVANKTGTLERIKNLMRRRIGNDSSKQSFSIFWSQAHLSQAGWLNEITFYDKNIKPLLETNYFRPMAETGGFVDKFWRIDIIFITIFGVEFLLRTYTLHRRHRKITWLDAMLWRWYDIFLLLPFWRWLRVIPVTIRLNQADLINLDRIQEQVNHGLVANFAAELTEVVVIRIINQLQSSIVQGDLTRLIAGRLNRPYIDINNVNEVEAIASLLVKVTVYQVLPKVQPDLEAILRHSLDKILDQSPVYQGVQKIPGLGELPKQLLDRLVNDVSQSTYKAIVETLEDPVGAKLANDLVQHFSEALSSEVQSQQTIQKIQSLLLDFLEEFKINYVQNLSEQDLEGILEQTRSVRRLPHP